MAQALTYGAAATVVTGVTILYGALIGIPGVALGLGVAAYYGWHVRRGMQLQRATRLLVHDRLDEAEALFNQILNARGTPRHTRALAEQNLAVVATRRGSFEEALKHERAAMALYARARKKTAMAQAAEYAEMRTLVNLGRVGEARQRFDQKKGVVPSGDYLRLLYWMTELYICLAEGRHRFDADALHERAHVALTITGAAALLGLTSWAHAQIGDLDQAWHLLREAYDRRGGQRIDRVMPLLHAWMEAHADEAAVDRKASDDEE
jgi:tetratricopeptide (TPR) repeat protein